MLPPLPQSTLMVAVYTVDIATMKYIDRSSKAGAEQATDYLFRPGKNARDAPPKFPLLGWDFG